MTNFTELVDLASERLGGAAVAANDEFFAAKENLVKDGRPVFLEHEYTDRGKWMDGWETRRRREPGHDWCVVRLGLAGTVRGICVDTAFFKGNFPESCSLEAGEGPDGPWVEILPKSLLRGDAENLFSVADDRRFTHVKLHIYPDGGVARLRVYGTVTPDVEKLSREKEVDLAGLENGGLVLAASDMFFGTRHNLILPGPPRGMHDGWETRRRRGPGHDWAILRLGVPGRVRRVEVDTSWFKGNAPGTCSVEVLEDGDALSSGARWREILQETPLSPDAVHVFEAEVRHSPAATHARFHIYPDGGVARLRLFGAVEKSPYVAGTGPAGLHPLPSMTLELESFNALPTGEAEARLFSCCASSDWARRMAAARPFGSFRELADEADRVWRSLSREGWLEAFAAHPKIGNVAGTGLAGLHPPPNSENGTDLFNRSSQQSTERGKNKSVANSQRFHAWSREEQGGTRGASPETLANLADANRDYEERFGHVFIVCASGRNAAEMLALAQARLGNDPATEIAIAAEEQRKITRLRLEKLLAATEK